jgi:hypothetical protein
MGRRGFFEAITLRAQNVMRAIPDTISSVARTVLLVTRSTSRRKI